MSGDGRIAYATVTLEGEPQDLTRDTADAIVDATQDARDRTSRRA